MKTLRCCLPVLTLAALAACGDPDSPPPAAEGPALQTLEYDEALGVDFDVMERTDRGIHYREVEEGTGAEAEGGHTVVVHYTGSLPDGQVFDTSRELGEPFTFELGAAQVIPGWDEGLQGMREGGRRTLVVPPDLAYGEAGAGGVIPPNAVLVFDVELLEVR